MNHIRKMFVLGFLTLTTLNSCKKEEIPYFSGDNSANFWLHAFNHSLFGASSAQLPQDTIVLNLSIVGKTADYDRIVKAVVDDDAPGTPEAQRLTTATPNQYQILDGIVPANKLKGEIRVVVKNDDILATKEDLKLRIKMTENKDFKVGLKENYYVNLKWSRLILQPSTWNGMRFFFCATYSTQVYKIFMEVTGLKQFYYYEGIVSAAEGAVMGTNFAKRVRELSEQQGSPLLHDDGPSKGLPIIPIY
jgi:hypothetical protein